MPFVRFPSRPLTRAQRYSCRFGILSLLVSLPYTVVTIAADLPGKPATESARKAEAAPTVPTPRAASLDSALQSLTQAKNQILEIRKEAKETILKTDEFLSSPENPTPAIVDPVPTPTPIPPPVPPVPVTLPHASIVTDASADPGEFLIVDGSGASGGTIRWKIVPATLFILAEGGNKLAVKANPPMDIIQVVSDGNSEHTDIAVFQVVLKNPVPIPTPVPPGPTPPPTPPVPPTPLPVQGFRALILYDAQNKSTLPFPQQQILNSTTIRAYMTAKAAKGADGKTPEFKVYDANVPTTNLPDVWKQAMTIPHTTLPWIIVSNGKTGFSGPLPATEADTLILLQKYGG